MTTIYTIGFTQKSAEQFFTLLLSAGVTRLIDTRLNNRSQLAGFAKANDLPYFLRSIGGIDYSHELLMAPTQDLLDRYKKLKGAWADYERDFNELLHRRELAKALNIADLDGSCLLCSEHEPAYCHRRLVAEYLKLHAPDLQIVHLL